MASSKKGNQTQITADHISLDVNDIRVEANPETVATMVSALIHIPSYRKRFEKDPVAHLKEVGIRVPANLGKQITPASIRATIDGLTEGGEERATAFIAVPGVAVAVRVGTRPGTRPGVNVGVSVVTGTSTFGAVRALEADEERPGLGRRQKGQAIKREKKAPDSSE